MTYIKENVEKKLEPERSLRSMNFADFYEQECTSAVYWDLVRKAYLCKK